MANNGNDPRPIAHVMAPLGEKGANRWALSTTVTPAELRGVLSRTRDECHAALVDAAILARVRAVLGLADDANLGDVLHAIDKLKKPDRK